ncbi:hypothetical protein Tco_0707030 [Tanacetum coccineum]|uniref:Tf2-1-like SH3-like domain-containing protein n=1 Tax=Tanacetum coccineum TaxID=301880 RepID=A0ABQ4Y925_9ASTR
MFPEESDKIEKYVGGLPDMIHRKLENSNQAQKQLLKRQNVAQAYAAGTGERKEYTGTLPLCNKCKFHRNGPCTVKCSNYKRVGPFKVLEQVESVAYKLKLPQELSRVYNMFHVSNLKKYYPDDPLVVPLEGLHVDEKLHFVEKPVEIMD